MKTTLRTRDRIILQNIMPTKGSYTDMSIITDVNSKVNLSQSEQEISHGIQKKIHEKKSSFQKLNAT